MTKLDTDKFQEDLCFNIKDKFEQTGYEDVSVASLNPNLILIKVDTIGVCITIDVVSVGNIKMNINSYFDGVLSLLINIDEALKETRSDWYYQKRGFIMDKISVFDLKKLGLLTGDSDDIYVVSEINQKLDSGDILAHSMDRYIESLEDENEELEADLEDANDDLEDVKDQLFYKGTELEDAEERVNYLEDILNKHNISY